MIRTAIAGNIASGKSQVENILINCGFKVIDSDVVNQNLLYSDKIVINQIKSVFGTEIFDEKGKISKKKLGEIVFNSPEKKYLLENILHTKIYEEINRFFEKNKEEKVVFASIPLLFEVNWEKNFDKIIFISADENLRLERLMKRNNFSYDEAVKRINSQQNEEEKIKKSDFVIYNNSDLKELKKSVFDVIEKLI